MHLPLLTVLLNSKLSSGVDRLVRLGISKFMLHTKKKAGTLRQWKRAQFLIRTFQYHQENIHSLVCSRSRQAKQGPPQSSPLTTIGYFFLSTHHTSGISSAKSERTEGFAEGARPTFPGLQQTVAHESNYGYRQDKNGRAPLSKD